MTIRCATVARRGDVEAGLQLDLEGYGFDEEPLNPSADNVVEEEEG